ncbi:MAG: acetyl-CoA carboxylase biotin carboxyl carrier protein subunit [Anaerolineae bacterium]|jgi:urea carboxylase
MVERSAKSRKGYLLFVDEDQDAYEVEIQGRSYSVSVEEDQPRLAFNHVRIASHRLLPTPIQAPLAGHLLHLLVAEGEKVEAGQIVAMVESMKMQMPVRTPLTGEVISVNGPADRDVNREDLVTVYPS